MWTPQETKERIANGQLLPYAMFKELDSDDILSARDGSFDDDWIRAAEAVQATWQESPALSGHSQAIDAVREVAFIQTFNASGGNHDLAASVSDDFELICKRALLGIESSFIESLERAYEAHRIPQ